MMNFFRRDKRTEFQKLLSTFSSFNNDDLLLLSFMFYQVMNKETDADPEKFLEFFDVIISMIASSSRRVTEDSQSIRHKLKDTLEEPNLKKTIKRLIKQIQHQHKAYFHEAALKLSAICMIDTTGRFNPSNSIFSLIIETGVLSMSGSVIRIRKQLYNREYLNDLYEEYKSFMISLYEELGIEN